MKIINVETINGIQAETVYEPAEIDFTGIMLSCKESKKRSKNGVVHYLEIPCAFDIETTNITEDFNNQRFNFTDESIYQHLHGIRLYYDDAVKNDISDFEFMRKRLFNHIWLKKGKCNIDTIYQELNKLFPRCFPLDVVNVSDQLRRIIDVYEQNKPVKLDDDFRPFAFMYHWQFCIGDKVIFGRRWEEFQNLLKYISDNMNLSSSTRLVVWVHNLSFEFQFMRRFINVTEGFFKDVNKPVQILTAEGIEFRDSYILSNMSLAKFCENEEGVTHYKLSGDTYDYSKIRTAETPLTEEEQAYCYNDVRGLCECIASRMKQDTFSTMPLTSTGYVRREFRSAMNRNPNNRQLFLNAKFDEHLYLLLRKAFRGGDTHANVRAANQIIHNVQSFDLASAYPAVMVTERFPMGKFTKISNRLFKKGFCEAHDMAYIARFRFWNLKMKKDQPDPYIPFSQCLAVKNERDEEGQHKNIYDNGRIIYADAVEIVLTDIDWKIMQDCYTWGRCAVREVWAAGYGFLPDEFRDTVKKYFRAKTELKGIPDKYYEYMRSKNRINSAYGMMVQKIIEDETIYENGEYETKTFNLSEQIEKFFKSRNSFLLYQWGVWVTAHTRARLHEGIKAAGRYAVYWDTDSVKCYGHDFRQVFDLLNDKYLEKAKAAEAYADDRKGVRHYMGIFEYEETYNRFITLGAKKYLVENEKGELHSTIAGVGRKQGAAFFRNAGMEAFKVGTVIENSGHLVAYYNDDQIHKITIDGCRMTTGSNLALVDDTYTLGVTGDYADLLEKVLNNSYDMIYTD